MAEVTAIHPADLRMIERNLGAIHQDLEVIDSGVGTVNDNVKVVYDEIGKLARDFSDFVKFRYAQMQRPVRKQGLFKSDKKWKNALGIMIWSDALLRGYCRRTILEL